MAQTKVIGWPAGGATQQLNIVECSICRESLDDSKPMRYGHVVCAQCTVKLNDVNRFSCPTCHRETSSTATADRPPASASVEELGPIELPTGKTVNDDDKTPGSCDVCSLDDDGDESLVISRMATMYCVDCQEKLCDTCSSFHSRSKVLQSHRLVDLVDRSSPGSDAGRNTARSAAAASVCERHTIGPTGGGARCCSDCDIIAGELAFEGDRDPSRLLAIVSAGVVRCRDRLTDACRHSRCALADRVAEVEAAVLRDADRLHEVINERRLKLLRELENWKIGVSNEMDDVARQTERFATTAKKITADAHRLTYDSTTTATRRLAAVQRRTEDLLKAERRLLHKLDALSRINVTFEPALILSTGVGDYDPYSIGRVNVFDFGSAGKGCFHFLFLIQAASCCVKRMAVGTHSVALRYPENVVMILRIVTVNRSVTMSSVEPAFTLAKNNPVHGVCIRGSSAEHDATIAAFEV